MTTTGRAAFLESFARAASSAGDVVDPAPEAWLQALVRTFVSVNGLSVDLRSFALFGPQWSAATERPDPAPDAWTEAVAGAGVDILGQAHEALLDAGHRHTRGVFYTPSDVATSLVTLTIGDARAVGDEPPPAVLDPAVGGGAFLVAAASVLHARGWPPLVIVEHALWGIDIDPLAVAITDAALRCWLAIADPDAHQRGGPVRTNLAVDDTLRNGPLVFPHAAVEGFDVVVGNPPFQNQLGASTARARAETVELRPWLGTAAYRYADTSTVFLAAALRLTRPGGSVGLILPQSFLVADDAAGVRDEVRDAATLEHLWVAAEPVFAAQVRVCAPVLRRHRGGGAPPSRPLAATSPQRWRGRAFRSMGPSSVAMSRLGAGATWAPLVADLFGLPVVDLPVSTSCVAPAPCLGDLCTATAGFRDQYYGLVPHVREASPAERSALVEPGAPRETAARSAALITCGLIGPAWSDWGRRPTRFAKQSWTAPVVDLGSLALDDAALHRWASARLVPKLVVATQTRVIEAVVDEHGRCYPSVPSISLTCAPEDLWAAAAVVMAPVVTLWAFHHHVGAALSVDALKVSAKQLSAAPLPLDPDAWARAATALQHAHRCAQVADAAGWRLALERFACDSADAYRLAPADATTVTTWWLDRLPTPQVPGGQDREDARPRSASHTGASR